MAFTFAAIGAGGKEINLAVEESKVNRLEICGFKNQIHNIRTIGMVVKEACKS